MARPGHLHSILKNGLDCMPSIHSTRFVGSSLPSYSINSNTTVDGAKTGRRLVTDKTVKSEKSEFLFDILQAVCQ
ncbi:hypothetical protein HI914_07407 [Erysiphe necator]|nr:hypothetical protein HI914_07407 [Erysiphe necator]